MTKGKDVAQEQPVEAAPVEPRVELDEATKAALRKRRDGLRKQIDALVEQANQGIASLQGGIFELNRLLGELPPQRVPPGAEQE